MDFWTWVIMILVGAIVVAVIQGINTSNKKKEMDDHLGQIKDFSATQKVMGSDGNTGLAIDERRKKICLINHRQRGVTKRVFLYKDLLSSEIFEDGATVTKTVRSSQLGGALIGGLALGGVGAIIGGLSGKTQTSGKVKRVDLRLTVNDTNNPLHDVNFLNLETKKDGILYKHPIQQARHWHGLIEVLIKRADIEDKRIAEMREWAIKHGINPHFAETLEYLLINESCKLQMIRFQSEQMSQNDIQDDDAWYNMLKQNLLVLTERWCGSYETHYDDSYFATKAYIQYEDELIRQEIQKLPDHSLMLDLGCATGRISLKFAEFFDQVVGYDLSQHMQVKANELAERSGLQTKVRFECADLEDGLPILDSTVSFIVMNLGTASDIRAIRLIVQEALRVLKPGGRFLFSFYNRDALMYRWDILPWSTGLAASVNIHKDSLDVHSINNLGIEEIISIYARAYTVEETQTLFSEFDTKTELVTYPTVSSILPNELFVDQASVQNLVRTVDSKLVDSGTGAYTIVTGEKSP